MIFNSGGPLSPKVTFEFNGVEVNYHSVNYIELELSENKHDILTVQVSGIPHKAITDYIGAAVRFTVSSGATRTQKFNGYVVYVEPESDTDAPVIDNSMFYRAKIVCLGASVAMKSTHQRVWSNTTIYKIAQELASKYRFSLDVLKDQFVIDRIVQANESDWEFLIRVCKTYGYSVTVHGTHMHVWDPFKAVGRRASYEELVPVSKYSGPVPGMINKFIGTFGQITPSGSFYRYGLNPINNDGTIVGVIEPESDNYTSFSGHSVVPKYSKTITESVRSVEEAEKFIGAYKRQSFPFNVHVEIAAGAGNVPGGVVKITGYDSNFEGIWYVRSVRHMFSESSYISELGISKDYNTSNQFYIPPVELAEVPPDSVFIDNTWRSEMERVNLYV